MKAEDVLNRVRDVASVRQVFGEPVERDGTVVVPVARIRGAGGGGGGNRASTEGSEGDQGSGGGLAIDARPLGVYVIRGGQVSWQPAVDVSRIVLRGQLVAILTLLLVMLRRRRSRGPR